MVKRCRNRELQKKYSSFLTIITTTHYLCPKDISHKENITIILPFGRIVTILANFFANKLMHTKKDKRVLQGTKRG